MERVLISNVESSYGSKKVLRDINICAKQGECVGIVGANGSGKSTLLNILSGLRLKYKGNIYFDGQLVTHKNAKKMFISYIGYVPQENNLISELSVKDNLLIWYQDKKCLEYEVNEGFLNKLGIREMYNIKVNKLSGGMKKRVSIACAMAGNPSILILDEPGAALDLPGKDDIRKYLVMYKQMGGTVIIATHEESDLDICDKIYALNKGESREIDKCLRGEALLRKINYKE